ncbi:MAG: Hsp70 family protein, partial [Actinomycetota bacterium]
MVAYRLGVDLGTTWTAAATWRDDRATIVSLGQRRAAIPSVAVLRDDGEFLIGDAAARRAVAEPERVAREFKRRIGDTTPLIVGGTPQTPEGLTARLLRFVVEQVSALEGGPPAELAIAHPANWGSFKIDLVRQIIAEAGQDPDRCLLITEPESAAITYATEQRVQPGQRVCVYDLGGGTFDTTVVERTTSGFRILGRPQGIERLGGVDFDAAVFAYVTERLGDALSELDPSDPTALSALARLRLDCTDAKEALSADVSATVPVFLPSVQTEIRITRSEFEGLVRPVLADTIETTRRAIASAELETTDIERVLLVGGSSRIPLVSQLVQNELDIDTAIDSHPKHAIALGTAIHHLDSDPGSGPGVTIVNDQRIRPRPGGAPPRTPDPGAAPTPAGSGGGGTRADATPAPGGGPTPAAGPAPAVPAPIDEDWDPDELDRGPSPSPAAAPPAARAQPQPQPGEDAAPASAAAPPAARAQPRPQSDAPPAAAGRRPPEAEPRGRADASRPDAGRGAGPTPATPPPSPANPSPANPSPANPSPAGAPRPDGRQPATPATVPRQPGAGPRPGPAAPSQPATPPPAGVLPAAAQPASNLPPGITPP